MNYFFLKVTLGFVDFRQALCCQNTAALFELANDVMETGTGYDVKPYLSLIEKKLEEKAGKILRSDAFLKMKSFINLMRLDLEIKAADLVERIVGWIHQQCDQWGLQRSVENWYTVLETDLLTLRGFAYVMRSMTADEFEEFSLKRSFNGLFTLKDITELRKKPAPPAVENENEFFEIFVRTLTNRILTFRVRSTTTIRALKTMLLRVEGIPVDDQRFIYAGLQLSDPETLAHYNITKEATLDFVLHLRGC
jgi:hypothetical protein